MVDRNHRVVSEPREYKKTEDRRLTFRGSLREDIFSADNASQAIRAGSETLFYLPATFEKTRDGSPGLSRLFSVRFPPRALPSPRYRVACRRDSCSLLSAHRPWFHRSRLLK